MEDRYKDEFGKVALALTSAQVAKTVFVNDFGIGEDLAFNFIGWKNGKLKIIVQLKKELMAEEPFQRLHRCSEMCRVIKSFWDIDAISMIAEGYCSDDPEKTKGLDLAKLYPEKDSSISECLTVTHVEGFKNSDPLLTLASINYKYSLNNTVRYDNVRVYPSGAINVLRDKSYPAMLYKTVRDSYFTGETEEMEVIDKITKIGFHIQIVD